MKLAFKLSLVLSAIISFLLCGALWVSYRGELGRLQRGQDAALRDALGRVAERCALSQNHDSEADCREGLRLLGSVRTLYYAAAMDARQRVREQADPSGGPAAAALAPLLGIASNRPGTWSATFSLQGPGSVRLFTHPLVDNGANVGVVVAAFQENALRRELEGVYREARVRFAQACLFGTAAGLLLSLGIVGYFLSPLGPLVDGVRRVASGDFQQRLPEERKDELGQLAVEFNRMASRLAEHEEIRRGFLSQITHDLRNPLHAMLGTMDVLLAGYRGTLAREQADSIKTLLDNGRVMSEMVNNIMDVSRLEAGQFKVAPASLELAFEVESVLDLLRDLARKCGVSLKADLPAAPEEVYADPQAFRRILTNLVANAVKFTPSGGQVTVKSLLGRRGETIVSVADTGIGIPQERMGMLFGKFSQVPETRNKVRENHGAGLGLFICKSLMEAHGGTIWAESAPGKGAAFYCNFPANPGSESPSP